MEHMMSSIGSVELAQRARVVAVAKEFVGTPYHHEGRLKGIGIDCATIIAEVFERAGVVPHIDLPPYSPMWHVSRDEERYTEFIRRFAQEVTGLRGPLPGDIVCWKFHRCFAHGAIVVDWPTVIHAFINIGCVEDDALKNQVLAIVSERVPTQGQPRPMKVFSYWRDA